MEQRESFGFGRNCIYCFKGGRQSKEHVFPRPLGYKLPVRMVCEECNKELGSLVDKALKHDYWLNLYTGKGIWDPTKSAAFSVRTLVDGAKELVEPYTDPRSWRPIAKAAYELMAYFVEGDIFRDVFDQWRSYVRFGKPDLGDPRLGLRPIGRKANAPNRWGNRHEVRLYRDRAGCVLSLFLYGSYEFFCRFDLPGQGDQPDLILTIDLDNHEVKLWRWTDPNRDPELCRVVRKGRKRPGIILP